MIKKYKIFEEYFDNDPLRVLGKTIVFENLGEALIISKILRDNGYTIFGHGAIHYSVRIGGCIAFTPLDDQWSRTHGDNFQLSTIRDVERGIGYLSFNDIVKRELLFNGKKTVDKDDTQGRIRWYKNGKLDESRIIDITYIGSEYFDDSGELVDRNGFEKCLNDLFKDKLCKFTDKDGYIYKEIVSNIGVEIYWSDEINIEFDSGDSTYHIDTDYNIEIFDDVDNIEVSKTKWYNKGVFENNRKLKLKKYI